MVEMVDTKALKDKYVMNIWRKTKWYTQIHIGYRIVVFKYQ